MYTYEDLLKCRDFVKEKLGEIPETAVVLGSGLGNLADELEDSVIVKYADIPGFPQSNVFGHKARLVSGKIDGVPVLCMQGRFHYYEGHSQQLVAFPVRVLGLCGVKNLILTNAAGGANKNFKPATLMCIDDHINFTSNNPLIGPNFEELGPRFPDMSNVYNSDLRKIMDRTAQELGIELQHGNYMYFTGPCYETPAEVRLAVTLGADAVGMSTVPEAIVANHMGLKVAGISCITNPAAGISETPLNHEEVIEASNIANKNFKALVRGLVVNIQEEMNDK